jgi:anti-sigma factor RsiW
MIDTEALSCQELVELVTDYLEGALSASDLRVFEAHLAVCPHCGEYLEQLRETIRRTGTLTPEDLSPHVELALMQAFRTWNRSSDTS